MFRPRFADLWRNEGVVQIDHNCMEKLQTQVSTIPSSCPVLSPFEIAILQMIDETCLMMIEKIFDKKNPGARTSPWKDLNKPIFLSW